MGSGSMGLPRALLLLGILHTACRAQLDSGSKERFDTILRQFGFSGQTTNFQETSGRKNFASQFPIAKSAIELTQKPASKQARKIRKGKKQVLWLIFLLLQRVRIKAPTN